MDSLSDIIYKALKVSARNWDKTRRYTNRYSFLDNRKNSDKLILILAGYQEYVWDDVFGRIKKYAPIEYDVCVVSPGKHVDKIYEMCCKNKWSYLSVKANKLAMALNTAIKLHPQANYIFKLDEDIFVCEHFFDGLVDLHMQVVREGIYKVGFVAPTMNINGASYRYFLKKIGRLAEYEEKFGIAAVTCDEHPVYKSGEAGLELWKYSLPLDATSKSFYESENGYFTAPMRYSIGAIMITRERWNDAGGFISSGNGQLAWDELCLCAYCFNYSASIIVSKNIFAGHFGFGPQKKTIVPFYNENKDLFGVN